MELKVKKDMRKQWWIYFAKRRTRGKTSFTLPQSHEGAIRNQVLFYQPFFFNRKQKGGKDKSIFETNGW